MIQYNLIFERVIIIVIIRSLSTTRLGFEPDTPRRGVPRGGGSPWGLHTMKKKGFLEYPDAAVHHYFTQSDWYPTSATQLLGIDIY